MATKKTLNSETPAPNPIAVVFALREEARPLLKEGLILKRIRVRETLLIESRFRGQKLVFCQTGTGMNRAHEGTERLIENFQPSLILSIGYAGGTNPSLKTGDLVLPSEIRSETPTDHFKTDPQAAERIEMLIREEGIPYQIGQVITLWKMARRMEKEAWGKKGVLAVEMETAAIAAVALKNRIPFLSLRAVFDTVEEELPFSDASLKPENPLLTIVKNPRALLQVPKFFRMNQLCQKNLARVVARFVDSFRG